MSGPKYDSRENLEKAYENYNRSGHNTEDKSFDEWKYDSGRSDPSDYDWDGGVPSEASQKEIDDYYFNYPYGDDDDDDDDDD